MKNLYYTGSKWRGSSVEKLKLIKSSMLTLNYEKAQIT